MRWRLACVLAAATGLAFCATASAASWTSAALLPSGTFTTDAVMTTGGDLVVVSQERSQPSDDYGIRVRVRLADGTWTGPDQLGTQIYTPAVVSDGNGGAWVSWGSGTGGRVAFRPSGGTFGSPIVFASGPVFTATLAANPRGDVAALFLRYEGGYDAFRVYLAYKPAGTSTFGAAEDVTGQLQSRGSSMGNVALAPDGTAYVGWTSGGVDQVRRRSSTGIWADAVAISSPGAVARYPLLAVDGLGRVVAVWGEAPDAQTAGHEMVAFSDAIGTWSAPVTAGPGMGVNLGNLRLSMAPSGRFAILYPEDAGPVRAVVGSTADRSLTDAQSLGATGLDTALSMAADGSALAAVTDFRTQALEVARLAAGASAFAEPEIVHCTPPGGTPAAVALEPTGHADVVWHRWSRAPLPAFMISRDDGSGDPPTTCPELPKLAVTPAVAPPGTERTLDLSPIIEPGEDDRFSFDFDGDGSWEVSHATSPTVHFTPTVRGRTTLQYLITDVDNNGGGGPVDVVTDEQPSVTLRPEKDTIPAGTSTTLIATPSIPAPGRVGHYEWDIEGDGTFVPLPNAPTVGITGPTPGTIHPTVRLVDDLGVSAEATTTVTVTPAGPPPPVTVPQPQPQPQPRMSARLVGGATVRHALRDGVRVRIHVPAKGTLVTRLVARRGGAGASRRMAVRGERRLTVLLKPSGTVRRQLRAHRTARAVVVVSFGPQSLRLPCTLRR